jgi:threonine 3-dehydrogenase
MRAVVKINAKAGAAGTTVTDVPTPEPGIGEVRVRVQAAAICGSDRHIYHWDPSVRHMIHPPRVYGHEFCGEIDMVGPEPGRDDLQPGDYVSAEMHVTCGVCTPCRSGQAHVCKRTEIIGFHHDGTFAEYVIVPARNIILLPREVVPLKIGAFLDALGNAVHTVEDHRLTDTRVAVLGYGPIGAMAVAIAEHQGAGHIYILDVSERAITQAERWHVDHGGTGVTVLRTGGDLTAEATRRILEETDGGVDLVLEMSGAESAINQGLEIARGGASLSMLGIPSQEAVTIEHFTRHLVFKGLSIRGITGRRLFSTWEKMLTLLADGLEVGSLVSHEYQGLDEFTSGMDAFDTHEALKVVFYPHGENGHA